MKHHLRSILALLLATLLLCGLLPVGAQAEQPAAARPTGRIHVTHPGSHALTDAYLAGEGASVNSTNKTALPGSYNSNTLGYVTAVRNQGSYGTCWAHGAMASVESYMIKNGIVDGTTGKAATKSINLSEYHLAWYNYTYAYDALNMLKGDLSKPYSAYLDLGGFGEMATYTLMRWEGPASESTAALAYSRASRTGLGAGYAYAYNIAHVSDVAWIPTANRDAVKQAIMEYGAGTFGYYHADRYSNDNTGAYCYIQSASPESSSFNWPNHDVTVVGWDDNYARTNFNSNSRPKENGAWIIKNSWGASMGDGGYYYISYEDTASYNDTCYFYTVEPVNNYDNIYQYDGTNNFSNYLSLGTQASIATYFTANGVESLEAVALCTWDEGVNYSVKIYLDADTTNPTSGTLVSAQTGSFPYMGYHTVKLNTPVTLAAGQRYAVVFELRAEELNVPYDASGSASQYVTWTHTTHANTSFYRTSGAWTATSKNGNFRIKAYTKNPSTHTHDYTDVVTPPSCTERGYTTHTCTVCGDSYVDSYTDALGHAWDAGVVTQEPTEDAEGRITYTCTRCGETKTEVLEKLAHTHDYTDAVTPPTCTEQGYTTHTCTKCGDSYVDNYTAALGHDWGEWRPIPTNFCTDPRIEDRTCDRCGATESRTLPPDGHTPGEPVKENNLAPTCEAAGGYDTVIYCTVCGEEISRAHTDVPARGHDWNEPEYVWADDYSTVTATRICKNDADHVETEKVNTSAEVTKEATYDAGGAITYTASFENEAFATQTKAVATPKLEKPDEPTPGLPCDGGSDCPGSVFTDMPAKGNWAHDAIDWAVLNAVTSGTSETTFSPNAGCTRAQVVTFLWRAAGSPEPTSTNNPFTDVTGGYYYKAVLWAVEKNITSGTSATSFSPNTTCTRAQIVTFLWRCQGAPAAATAANPFKDVKPGAYYEKAVLWAAETGVTAGTSATAFSPDATCTRAQVVTFLYRSMAGAS